MYNIHIIIINTFVSVAYLNRAFSCATTLSDLACCYKFTCFVLPLFSPGAPSYFTFLLWKSASCPAI